MAYDHMPKGTPKNNFQIWQVIIKNSKLPPSRTRDPLAPVPPSTPFTCTSRSVTRADLALRPTTAQTTPNGSASPSARLADRLAPNERPPQRMTGTRARASQRRNSQGAPQVTCTAPSLSSSRLSAADGGWSGPCGRSIGGFGGAFAREKLILDGYHLVLLLRNRRIARREVIPCSVACAHRRVTGE